MISEERGYMTISGKSLQECKEKLYERYGRDYKILDQRDDFESYGLFNLRKRPIKVVNYVVTHRKSYNTDNYFINNANEEDELEQNRQAILQANNTTLLTSQLKEVNKTLEDFKAEVANQLKSYSHSMSEQHETITKIQSFLYKKKKIHFAVKFLEF